jgi:hypothetical protein
MQVVDRLSDGLLEHCWLQQSCSFLWHAMNGVELEVLS